MELREFYLLKRRRLGITLQQIADFFGVHKSTASRWETGKLPIPEAYMEYLNSKEREEK